MITGTNIIIEVEDESTSIVVEATTHNSIRSFSVAFGSKVLDRTVKSYFQQQYDLLIGEKTAEAIRLEVGSAYQLDEPLTMEVRARRIIEGTPEFVIVSDEEIRGALADQVSYFVTAARLALEQTPREFLAGVMERSIFLKRGEVLKGLSRRLSIETNLPVTVIS